MGLSNKSKVILRISIGSLMLLVNAYWTYQNLNLYYLYHFSDILFVLMLPDWVLFGSAVPGLVGIYFSIKVMTGKLTVGRGVLLQLAIVLLWTIIDLFYFEIEQLFLPGQYLTP